MIAKTVPASPVSERQRVLLDVRLEDLKRALGAPGDWGYGTELGELTNDFLNLHSRFMIALHGAES